MLVRSGRYPVSYTGIPAPDALTKFLAETLHVLAPHTAAVTVSPSSFVAMNASPDHAIVTSYTARLRTVAAPGVIVDTLNLGVPTPDGSGVMIVNLASLFSGKAAGDYTVSVLTTTATGSADSASPMPSRSRSRSLALLVLVLTLVASALGAGPETRHRRPGRGAAEECALCCVGRCHEWPLAGCHLYGRDLWHHVIRV